MAEQHGAAGRPFTASPSATSASGFTTLSDVDSTVLAYAQWLSELQQHAQAKYHQKAELEVLRESVSAQNVELNDFKRHCMGSIQQIQQQVSDLKLTMADLQRSVSEMKIQVPTYLQSVEVKTNLTELQDLGLGDPFSGAGSPARSPVPNSAARSSAGLEISKLYRIIREVQEMTLAKFGEVDEAMKILHGHSNALQKDLQGSHADWKKSQELLSQAVAGLSQDLGDFRQHVSSTTQKSQTEILQLQEGQQVDAECLSRLELQVSALHQTVQANTNDLILLRGERGERGERPVSPQRRPVPTPGQRLQGQSHSHLLELLDQQAQIRAGVKRT